MYVPCSGLTGENLTGPCNEPLLRGWYNGPSLLERIGKSSAKICFYLCILRPISKKLKANKHRKPLPISFHYCVGGEVKHKTLDLSTELMR